jgi:hypothetical protein
VNVCPPKNTPVHTLKYMTKTNQLQNKIKDKNHQEETKATHIKDQ